MDAGCDYAPVDIASGSQTNMGWTVANPADIDFDAVNSLIRIPNTSTSTVTLETVDDCITGVADLSAIGGLYHFAESNYEHDPDRHDQCAHLIASWTQLHA